MSSMISHMKQFPVEWDCIIKWNASVNIFDGVVLEIWDDLDRPDVVIAFASIKDRTGIMWKMLDELSVFRDEKVW